MTNYKLSWEEREKRKRWKRKGMWGVAILFSPILLPLALAGLILLLLFTLICWPIGVFTRAYRLHFFINQFKFVCCPYCGEQVKARFKNSKAQRNESKEVECWQCGRKFGLVGYWR